MDVISTFMVSPSLPNKLQHLQTLAYNIWWAWNLDAVDLFRRLDPDLWETSGHNPVMMLGTIKQERLEQAAQDEGYVGQLESVYHHFQEYLKSKSTWFHRTFGSREKADGQPLIAYFSMEYGLTE